MSGQLSVASTPDSRLKTWKRRWFHLRDAHLFIYKSKVSSLHCPPLEE